ncbi:hypothetical protein M422DRAFT_155658, partial [Sphaerobolus stellatus SS14]
VVERFQRSGDTISRCFHCVLKALACLEVYNSYIKFLNNDSPVPDQIRQNPMYFPFLKGVLRTIDGSHLPV